MDETKINLNNGEQVCTCAVSNDSTTDQTISTPSVPRKVLFENTDASPNQIIMDNQDCKITIEVNNDQILLDANLSTNSLVKDQDKESPALEVENELSSISSSENINNPSIKPLVPQSSSTIDTLEDIPDKHMQKRDDSVKENNLEVESNNKIIEPEEMTIEIDSEHSKDFIKRKNLRNLSNQHSPSGDLYYIGKLNNA